MPKSLLQVINAVAILLLTACHPIEEYNDDAEGNFEALWSVIDQHYCFFGDKGDVDWDEVHQRYSKRVVAGMSRRQLFGVCAAMVNELRDGHVNLSAPFETSYYRKWWSDYPQNFDERLLEQYVLNFEYKQLGPVTYAILPQNVGYIRIPSFESGLGSGNIDWILNYLATCSGIIIDVRDNGGGSVSNAETWVRHFMRQSFTACYMKHKNGPGHDDFDEPKAVTYQPVEKGHLSWFKPVILLTNRSTFSAANYFTMVMRELPQVIHAGATTGGGSGMPLTMEIPAGWSIRMSAVSVLDSEMQVTEYGIAPHEGAECELDPAAALEGRDSMIDYAITLIK